MARPTGHAGTRAGQPLGRVERVSRFLTSRYLRRLASVEGLDAYFLGEGGVDVGTAVAAIGW